MNTLPAHRVGRHVAAPTPYAPNAALLIDFDNVTLGVRSDLTKELRHLLNSEIIKGKVAVQRAYADWRRYPQYIVPLSESSIDLIFAPAFGTNKKNATDIRLAVDAIELVFTRPEIGTIILLSGDSDFSSLVLKLKEYGKYVIGVGIRESASDILIQNCDEYYSYSDLAGLTKESEVSTVARDPWELVVEATAQMQRNGDVMRSDRLKQVMQQIDPNFDESNAGFNRFSKFVTEAGTRGLIKVIRQENGQFDVAPLSSSSPAASASAASSAPRESSRGRGRGRGDRPKPPTTTTVAPPPVPSPRVEAAAETPAEREERAGRRRRGRGRGRGRGDEGSAPVAAEPSPAPPGGLTLAEAFHLLSRALGELPTPAGHETLRARMAALHGKEDPLLDPVRFPRLLRQANDAEVADVRVLGDDQYEVSPHKTDLSIQRRPAATPAEPLADGTVAPAAARAPAALRFRSGARAGSRLSDVPMVGVVSLDMPSGTSASVTPTSTSTNGDAGVVAPAVPTSEPMKSKARRGTRGGKGRKPGTKAALTTPAIPAAPVKKAASGRAKSAKVAKVATTAKVTKAAAGEGGKKSAPRNSKPRAG